LVERRLWRGTQLKTGGITQGVDCIAKVNTVATDINDRVDKLEEIAEKTAERLLALERDVAIIKVNYATKSDLAELKAEIRVAFAKAKTSIIMWVVSAIFLAQLLPALLKNFGLYAH
jgi:hypothetical protein